MYINTTDKNKNIKLAIQAAKILMVIAFIAIYFGIGSHLNIVLFVIVGAALAIAKLDTAANITIWGVNFLGLVTSIWIDALPANLIMGLILLGTGITYFVINATKEKFAVGLNVKTKKEKQFHIGVVTSDLNAKVKNYGLTLPVFNKEKTITFGVQLIQDEMNK